MEEKLRPGPFYFAPNYRTLSPLRRRRRKLLTVLSFAVLTLCTFFLLWNRLFPPEYRLDQTRIPQTFRSRPGPLIPGPPLTTCANITREDLDQLHNVTRLTIRTFADGKAIAATASLQAPQAVCILIAVPQIAPDYEFDAPVPGKGPDAIHLYLNSSEGVIVTFPPLRPLPSQVGLNLPLADHAIIYYAESTLFTPGIYNIQAKHEWANWRWAYEWAWDTALNLFIFASGMTRPAGFMLASLYAFTPTAVDPADMYPPQLHVTGNTILPERPFCSDNITAGRGRWYNAEAFEGLQTELVDEWGGGWEGDACRIDYYDTSDIFDCLANKVIHVYGDSMLRRVSKTLLAGGRWCLNPLDKCQTEDDRDEIPVTKLVHHHGALVEATDDRTNFGEHSTSPIRFGKNTYLYFSFSGSLISGPHSWVPALFDPEDLQVEDKTFTIKDGVTARAPPHMAPADLVIFGVGAWDSALDEHAADFAGQLPRFRNALLQAYDGVPMVMRLQNTFFGRGNDVIWRRYSGPRVQHFDDMLRRVFHIEETDGSARGWGGRLAVLDPSYMGGRPEVWQDFGGAPGNNHPRASHVRIETQMLLNSVCERDEITGKARLRSARVGEPVPGLVKEETGPPKEVPEAKGPRRGGRGD